MSNGTIPPPPYLGPLPTPAISVTPNGLANAFVCEYLPDSHEWVTSPYFTISWDTYPTGYILAPFSTPGHPVLIVVAARTRPDGSVAPNVLEYPNWVVVNGTGGAQGTGLSPEPQPPPPPLPSPQCPPGFIWVPNSILDIAGTEYPGGQPLADGQCIPIGPTWPPWAPQPKQ